MGTTYHLTGTNEIARNAARCEAKRAHDMVYLRGAWTAQISDFATAAERAEVAAAFAAIEAISFDDYEDELAYEDAFGALDVLIDGLQTAAELAAAPAADPVHAALDGWVSSQRIAAQLAA